MSEKRVILKPERDKSVRRFHPWIFSGAVARLEGAPADGDEVVVCSAEGEHLARGYFNSRSQICVRLLTWDVEQRIDGEFWRRRIRRALEYRRALGLGGEETTAYRLIHAESDQLPGLVVDCYGPFLVVQFLTLGVERRREEILDALKEVMRPAGIYERSDVEVREKEGLPLRTGLVWGEMPPAELEVRENRWRFVVDVQHGQKTGFYLDQRVNRERVGRYAGGAEVLNCFSYTGGFGVYAAAGGARRIVNIDTSASALEWCARHLERNGFGGVPAEQVEGDVFRLLRRYRQEGRRFDLVILDPPKFATTQANVMAAARGYKDINLLAMQLLRPGGILATFSCSGLVSADLFQKIVFGASADARRPVQILEYLAQSPDHPVLLSFPESAYLKGLICRVLT